MTQTTFIGRTAELQWLGEFLKKAGGGHLQVAFIAGEAGAGKSSLVQKFVHNEEELDSRNKIGLGYIASASGRRDRRKNRTPA